MKHLNKMGLIRSTSLKVLLIGSILYISVFGLKKLIDACHERVTQKKENLPILQKIKNIVEYSAGSSYIWLTPLIRKINGLLIKDIYFYTYLPKNNLIKNIIIICGGFILSAIGITIYLISIVGKNVLSTILNLLYKILQKIGKIKGLGHIAFFLTKILQYCIEFIIIMGDVILHYIDEFLYKLVQRYVKTEKDGEFNKIKILNLRLIIKDFLIIIMLFKGIKWFKNLNVVQNSYYFLADLFDTIKETVFKIKVDNRSSVQIIHDNYFERIAKFIKELHRMSSSDDVMFAKTQIMILAREIKLRFAMAARHIREFKLYSIVKLLPNKPFNPFLNPVLFDRKPSLPLETAVKNVEQRVIDQISQPTTRIQLPNTERLHKFFKDFPPLKPFVTGAIATGAFLNRVRKKTTVIKPSSPKAMPELGQWSRNWPERLAKAVEQALPNPNYPSNYYPGVGYLRVPNGARPVDINFEHQQWQNQ